MRYIEFLGLIIAIWLFTTASAPIQWLKETLNIHNLTKSENIITLAIMKLVNCSLCFGFWCGLIWYQNFFLACIVSLTAEIFTRIASKFLA